MREINITLLLFASLCILGCRSTTSPQNLRKTEQKTLELKKCNIDPFSYGANSPTYKIQNGPIIVYSGAKSDFFNAPDGSGCTATAPPLLLREIDNTKPFTFSTLVKPQFKETYDAGAIYVFYDQQLWQKFAFEMDERKLTRLVTVRTITTSDDNNHDSITQEEAYMKISSDTKNIGFYYSLDGNTWQLVRLYRNEYPKRIYLAISSQPPIGNGNETLFSNIVFSENSIQNFRLGL